MSPLPPPEGALRVLVVQHEDDDPPALLGQWMRAAAVVLDVRCGHLGDTLPARLDGYDGLLVLGGEMGAYDDARHPWLTPTKELIRQGVDARVPVLGICLGHQLAAVALGGTVGRHPGGPQIGVFDVGWTTDAASDVLVGDLAADAATGSATPAVQWNNDVVTDPPPGSTVLARAAGGAVQILRFAPRAWGLQMHPEVDRELVARWAQSDPSAPVALERIGAMEPALRTAWRRAALAFVRQLAATRSPA